MPKKPGFTKIERGQKQTECNTLRQKEAKRSVAKLKYDFTNNLYERIKAGEGHETILKILKQKNERTEDITNTNYINDKNAHARKGHK